jgi:hypothetical protein
MTLNFPFAFRGGLCCARWGHSRGIYISTH